MLLTIPLACTPEEQDPVIEAFLQKTLTEQASAIRDYPLEKQVELYLAAMMRKHPSDPALASVVAENGAAIVPILSRRLSEHEGDGDIEKTRLVDVFVRMQRLGTYDVASDKKLMKVLEQQVAGIEGKFWKELSDEFLQRIRTHQK